jgi:anti-anti-sigma factor
MSLKVNIARKEPGIFIVSLTGPLDAETHLYFESQIEPIMLPATKVIILNMEGVNYISSLGIGTVFELTNRLKKNNGDLLFTNMQPQIQKVFDIVKASPDSIFKSLEEADEYLNAIQRKYTEDDNPHPAK